MKKSLGMICLLWSSISLASITGNWNGWGSWSYEDASTPCDPMNINFIETSNKLTRTGGYFNCQVVGLELDAKEWEKKDGKVIVDGAVVGSYSENSFHITEQYSENVKVDSDIVKTAGHLDYSEVWYDKNDNEIYEIKGRFF
jgi:hypothetical protein